MNNIVGVHGVEFDLEKNEIKVKGIIEVVKIHKQIEKWSKKKVELISPKPTEVKKPTTTTTTTTSVVEKKTTEVKKVIFASIIADHIYYIYTHMCVNVCSLISFNYPQEVIRTTVLKVHIHCAQCDKDLQNKLLKHKGKIESLIEFEYKFEMYQNEGET